MTYDEFEKTVLGRPGAAERVASIVAEMEAIDMSTNDDRIERLAAELLIEARAENLDWYLNRRPGECGACERGHDGHVLRDGRVYCR